MSYATAEQFRARYPEFVGAQDADVAVALDVAATDIKGYLPPGEYSADALAILADRSLPLARLALYQDEALDQTHQAIRDAETVRTWLRMVARGEVKLELTEDGETKTQGVAVKARAAVFSSWDTY